MPNKYLNVGKDYLTTFRPITDPTEKNYKPQGGKWFTIYDERFPNYNEWLDFLTIKPNIIFYKHLDPNHLPCTVISLKENAKIFNLTTKEALQFLIEKYPDQKGFFSYEALSQDYDGIFVKPNKVIRDIQDEKIRCRISCYDVQSLLLFNSDVIDYYQSGFAQMNNFDFTNFKSYELEYKIHIDPEIKYINENIKQTR